MEKTYECDGECTMCKCGNEGKFETFIYVNGVSYFTNCYKVGGSCHITTDEKHKL